MTETDDIPMPEMAESCGTTVELAYSERRFFQFEERPGADYRFDYKAICDELNRAKVEGDEAAAVVLIRGMCRADIFFLGYFAMDLAMLNHPWVVKRIYEAQDSHDGFLNLWSREHFKSTVLSFLLPIWIVLNDPERRILFLSYTRTQAQVFLFRVQQELQRNAMLKYAFSDLLWASPKLQAPKWGVDSGLLVRRKSNHPNPTFSAGGLIESLPTGGHFTDLVYDDVVTPEGVSSSEVREKILYQFRQSLNLASDVEGSAPSKKWMSGTPYHFADLYASIVDEGIWDVRVHPATKDGTKDGEPVLWSKQHFMTKYASMGSYVGAAQLLMKPVAPENQKFKIEWLRYYEKLEEEVRTYLFVDPANGKRADKSDPDYTVFVVISINSSYDRFLRDGARLKIELTDKWKWMKYFYTKWKLDGIYYEKIGHQSDTQYFKERSRIEGLVLGDKIEPVGGIVSKFDRIMSLVPNFENGQFYLPHAIHYKKGEKVFNFVSEFIEKEYTQYPMSTHDDMLDAMARINDPALDLRVPEKVIQDKVEKEWHPLDEIDFARRRDDAWLSM